MGPVPCGRGPHAMEHMTQEQHISAMGDPLGAIKPADLPSPPAAAMQIVRACAREDVGSAELAGLAGSDPVLTAELLRVVNSAFFGLSRAVRTIPHAVMVLGQRALRNLALCIAVRDALGKDAIPGFNVADYWVDALRRAVSARLLAELLGLDTEECFTAGLLQDFGLLVMLFLWPEKATLWPTLRQADPDTRYAMEQRVFHTAHDQVALTLAQAWELPTELSQALGDHHRCANLVNGKPHVPLCRLLYCSDWMGAVYSAEDKGPVIASCRRVVAEHLGMDARRIEACLSAVPGKVEEASTALGLRVPQQPDFNQVMREANVILAAENLSYQELTWRLEKALKERDQLTAELNREMEMARETQTSLLPRPSAAGFPVSGLNLPARELSGDFYDFFPLKDGRVYFNLGDVSGKGTNAALLMAKTIGLFRCLGKQVFEPGRLMAHINNEVCETAIRGMFVTMVAGLYDPQHDRICLANAGHLPGLLVNRAGKVTAFGAQAPPIGVVPDALFPESNLTLAGGSLFLFSDGVTESYVADGEVLGLRGLLKLILELRGRAPQQRLETIVARLCQEGVARRDDITLLLVEAPGTQ